MNILIFFCIFFLQCILQPQIPKGQILFNAGIDYLYRKQNEDGSFNLFYSRTPEMNSCRYHKTIFSAAYIGLIIKDMKNVKIEFIHSKLANYLLNNHDKGRWNFYHSSENLKIPNDLDDTVLSLLSIETYANVSYDYLNDYINNSGYYNTWFDLSDEYQDTDIIVNYNILSLLKRSEINIDVQQKIFSSLNNNIESMYWSYSSKYFLLFSLYNAQKNGWYEIDEFLNSIEIKEMIINSKTPIDIAISLIVVLDMNLSIDDNIILDKYSELIKAYKGDGDWGIYSICMGPKNSYEKYYWGSNEIVTAFVIRAVDLYLTKFSVD